MVKPKRDEWVKRPDPTLTVPQILAAADAENALKLAQDLVSFLPHPYKEELKRKKGIHITLDKYTVGIWPRG